MGGCSKCNRAPICTHIYEGGCISCVALQKNNKINGSSRRIRRKNQNVCSDTVTKEKAHIKMPYFSL